MCFSLFSFSPSPHAALYNRSAHAWARRHSGSVLLLLGDSNDRNAVKWLCGVLKGELTTEDTDHFHRSVSHARKGTGTGTG